MDQTATLAVQARPGARAASPAGLQPASPVTASGSEGSGYVKVEAEASYDDVGEPFTTVPGSPSVRPTQLLACAAALQQLRLSLLEMLACLQSSCCAILCRSRLASAEAHVGLHLCHTCSKLSGQPGRQTVRVVRKAGGRCRSSPVAGIHLSGCQG